MDRAKHGNMGMSPEMAPLGNSDSMRELRALIRQVAPHNTLVLLRGESGSGKEVVARSIHQASSRSARPFVPVNCGAIPADLLESELFGHEKGAFTGAICARKGRFEMAEGGTLFLDEIGDMSLPMQVKLLRVLQERCFERVGGNDTIRCNVRIIAATHRNLEEMINEGSFRHDLFFRLNVFPIVVPPLRDHVQDIPQLVEHLLGRLCGRGMMTVQFKPTAMRELMCYPWPGNIRELENLLERLSITHGGQQIGVGDLPPQYRTAEYQQELDGDLNDDLDGQGSRRPASDVQSLSANSRVSPTASLDSNDVFLPDQGVDLKSHLQQLEKSFITKALRCSNGTVAHAAQLLGLQRTTLAEKMKKFGLQMLETS